MNRTANHLIRIQKQQTKRNSVPGSTAAGERRPGARESGGVGRPAKAKLTDRDKQLLAILAMARYFATGQIARLFFSGCSPKTMRKRLLRLAGEGASAFSPPYLRRLFYRAYADGERVEIWAIAPRSHATVRNVIGAPIKTFRNDIGAAFREHTIVLNELLVALYAPSGRGYARAKQDAFRWHSSDSVRLPWKEYAPAEDRSLERVVLPDAILEIPRLKRRLFLECETGTHSIVATGNPKPGATLAKVERYESFLRDFADDEATKTFYQQTYPDGWKPEVVFLVFGASRAQSINRAIQQWQEGRSGSGCVRALTFKDASLELTAALRQIPSPSPNELAGTAGSPWTGLSAEELTALRRFYNGAVVTMKTVRAKARSRNEVPPDYPPHTEDVRALIERLQSAAH
jgi:hypothetical protein